MAGKSTFELLEKRVCAPFSGSAYVSIRSRVAMAIV